MFPLYDENPTELTPYLTFAVVAACVAAWFLLQGAGFRHAELIESVCTLGLIPAEVTGSARPGEVAPLARGVGCELGGRSWSTVLTSMFLHGSWGHIIGNLWFLWIFGNNVEDSMGHLRFVAFYLLCGLAAAGAQVLSEPGARVPMVGASGAISGVMGAYLVFYPRVRVFTLFFFVFFIRVIPIPAWLVLGEWLLIQLLYSGGGASGVAVWAHIGGFVAGVALAKLFENPQLVGAKRTKTKLDAREIRHGGWW